MLVKARKASIEDRISKRLKSCLGKSTFRPPSFYTHPLPGPPPPSSYSGLPHHWTPHFSTDPSLSPPVAPYQEAASACSHAVSLPRHQGPSHLLMTPLFPRSFRFCNFTFPHSFIFSHDPLLAPSLFPHDVTFLTNLSHDASYWTHPLIHCLAPF